MGSLAALIEECGCRRANGIWGQTKGQTAPAGAGAGTFLTKGVTVGTSRKSRPPKSTAAAHEARAIVLFSDGTGNSSGKLFKTNVWRMYEAVDLGPATKGKRKQIGFYDSGVGTSAFRPLAAI